MSTTGQIAEKLADHQTQLKYALVNFNDTHLRRGLFNFFGGGVRTPQLKIELNENEKLIYDLVSASGSSDLNAVKEKCGFSNKQWDVAVKSLTKQGLLKVSKIGETLMIEAVA